MLGLETLTCLHNIPVVRSSTDKLHDVYAKAKDTSILIRLPCVVAETVADKSLQIALTIASPFVKPLRGPVRVIDDFAAQKIRQMESKYPAIKTPTQEVVNSFKDSTASTLQHGKETVSNVATATVNKASDVADSVFSLVQGRDTNKPRGMVGRLWSPVGSLWDYAFQSVQSSMIWFRMLVVFFLLKTKQINDIVLQKMQQTPFLTTLPQRVLIIAGAFLDYFIGRIRPDDRTLADLKKSKQQSRLSQQPQYHANRQSGKHESSSVNTTRHNDRHEPSSTNTARHSAKHESSSTNTARHSAKPEQSWTNTARHTVRPEPSWSSVVQQNARSEPAITTRQSVVVTQEETVVTRTSQPTIVPAPQPDYSHMTDAEELHARLANSNIRPSGAYHVNEEVYTTGPADLAPSADIAELHQHLNPTDVELLYSRLPSDVLPTIDNQEPLTEDQQTLHARLIGAELERQGYREDQ